VLIAVHWGVYIYAVETRQVLQASLGYFLTPLVNVGLGMLVLKESISRVQVLAVVLDLYARQVVDWAMSSSLDADLVVKVLDRAREQRGQPERVMFHSGQGSQYASRKFRQRFWRYRMRQSMSRHGNCWENALGRDCSGA
tara:strand:- start:855 stop:1274 length:420 start_codon:yes stop_codon:yes gene_type:complete